MLGEEPNLAPASLFWGTKQYERRASIDAFFGESTI